MNSNLIYKINCKDCPGCYIGQTKQYLKNRVYQHKHSIKSTLNNLNNKTALTTHTLDKNHNFDFENTEILQMERNYNNV